MKKVLITGGTRGIGAACVREFSKNGYEVAFSYRSRSDLAEALKRELAGVGPVHGYFCDLSDFSSVKQLANDVENQLGGIDILINNAGVDSYGLVQDATEEEYERVFDTNFKGAFFLTSALIPSMIRNHWGRIVNISSVWGQAGASCEVLYSSAKAALIGFTKALGKELAPSLVTVNCICPGVIETDMLNRFSASEREGILDEIPAMRFGKPCEIAESALFLSKDSAAYITGQILGVNGGFYC